DLWVRDPREQAMFVFIAKTFARSRNHRLVLLAYLGLAAGWLSKTWIGGLNAPAAARVHPEALAAIVIVVSLVIGVVIAVALRYLFTLPVELGANWIFQISEQDGRICWLRAVQRFVIWCGIAPVYFLLYPLAAAVMGSGTALAASAAGFGLVLLVFELLFLSWNKVPFTCSYLPGKRPVVFQTVPTAVALTLLAPCTAMVWFGSHGIGIPIVLVSEIIAIVWLHRYRWQLWLERPLSYVDNLDPAVTTLDIGVRLGERIGDDDELKGQSYA